MKTYKDFEKKFIGCSDIAALTVRSIHTVYNLQFLADGCYSAYECFGEVEIGNHYTKVFTGENWIKIYDDDALAYSARYEGMTVDIYRAGEFGCIIHWH